MTFPNDPPPWTNPDLPPDQFLYGRQGPWPQPSPAHPLKEAPEVLNVPLAEQAVWTLTVGKRLVESAIGFPPYAAIQVNGIPFVQTGDFDTPIPTDDQFNQIMLNTVYSRFYIDGSNTDRAKPDNSPGGPIWFYNFTAMELVKPLPGLYCAPLIVWFATGGSGNPGCYAIQFVTGNTSYTIRPGEEDPRWGLAKIFALQAAAYHSLFVVHPAEHFPFDSVNAITKTAVPRNHPLFELLYPHTSYQLALDNAVLEGPNSVLNNNVQGTWFDPFMSDAYNLTLLFGAGYTGLSDTMVAYPPFDYMKPQMGFGPNITKPNYGQWLADYFAPFLYICEGVAENILMTNKNDTYVKRWARYCSSYIQGFPDEKAILDKECLAKAMAIFMWDTTVSHGGDHYSFMLNIPAAYKFLRIRVPPPPPSGPPAVQPKTVGDVATRDDLYRTELGQLIFFGPHAMKPNLSETYYSSTNPVITTRQIIFHEMLKTVSNKYPYGTDQPFMPLLESQVPTLPYPSYIMTPYELTIPQSIQY